MALSRRRDPNPTDPVYARLPDVCTPEALAGAFDVTQRTLRRWRKRLGNPLRMASLGGKRLYVDRETVLDWIRSNLEIPPAPGHRRLRRAPKSFPTAPTARAQG